MQTFRFIIDVSVKGKKSKSKIRSEIARAIRATQRKPDKELDNWVPIPLTLEGIESAQDIVTGPQSKTIFTQEETSIQEKDMLIYISRDFPAMRKRLKYPLKTTADGNDQEYEIPAKDLEKTLKLVCPFDMNFSPEAEFVDIHESKLVKAKDLRIIICHGVNMIISPYYAHSGGTLVDLVDPERLDKGGDMMQLRTITI